MDNSQKIAALLGERQKIEKEIAKIQQLCQHSTKSIKYVRERLDSTTMVVRWTCDTCFSIVGIPNNEEINGFFRE